MHMAGKFLMEVFDLPEDVEISEVSVTLENDGHLQRMMGGESVYIPGRKITRFKFTVWIRDALDAHRFDGNFGGLIVSQLNRSLLGRHVAHEFVVNGLRGENTDKLLKLATTDWTKS